MAMRGTIPLRHTSGESKVKHYSEVQKIAQDIFGEQFDRLYFRSLSADGPIPAGVLVGAVDTTPIFLSVNAGADGIRHALSKMKSAA